MPVYTQGQSIAFGGGLIRSPPGECLHFIALSRGTHMAYFWAGRACYCLCTQGKCVAYLLISKCTKPPPGKRLNYPHTRGEMCALDPRQREYVPYDMCFHICHACRQGTPIACVSYRSTPREYLQTILVGGEMAYVGRENMLPGTQAGKICWLWDVGRENMLPMRCMHGKYVGYEM